MGAGPARDRAQLQPNRGQGPLPQQFCIALQRRDRHLHIAHHTLYTIDDHAITALET